MNWNRFDVDSDMATLMCRGPARQLLTLDDEVGHIRPGKLPYIQPPVKYEHTETEDERLEREAVERENAEAGEPLPLWAHVLVWTVLSVFTVGACVSVVNLIQP